MTPDMHFASSIDRFQTSTGTGEVKVQEKVMLMNRVLLLGLLFVGSTGLSNAAPLDSPDIVYIDGAPRNTTRRNPTRHHRNPLSADARQDRSLQPVKRGAARSGNCARPSAMPFQL